MLLILLIPNLPQPIHRIHNGLPPVFSRLRREDDGGIGEVELLGVGVEGCFKVGEELGAVQIRGGLPCVEGLGEPGPFYEVLRAAILHMSEIRKVIMLVVHVQRSDAFP